MRARSSAPGTGTDASSVAHRSSGFDRRAPNWLRGASLRLIVVLVLGLLPWPGSREAFSAAYRSLAGLVLADVRFGGTEFGPGRVEVMASQRPERSSLQDGPSWDTALRLSVGGVEKAQQVYVNPRRTAYLPLLLFIALTVAAPLPLRSRLSCIAIGTPILLAVAIAGLWITALWIFSQVPGLVYDWAPAQRTAVELAYRTLVVPTANRFTAPLLLAGVLALWQHRQSAVAAAPRQRAGAVRTRKRKSRARR